MHGRAHDREQVPSTAGESSALWRTSTVPAVTIEEEGDEYSQTELEKADAEHSPTGDGDVGGRADQLLELNYEGGCVVGQPSQ